MAKYRISGIWKDNNDIITHYAFHEVGEKSVSRSIKYTKAQAISILEKNGNSAVTWIWNYSQGKFKIGENVHIVNDLDGKYLRSDPDNKLTNNLSHLIDFDWILK